MILVFQISVVLLFITSTGPTKLSLLRYLEKALTLSSLLLESGTPSHSCWSFFVVLHRTNYMLPQIFLSLPKHTSRYFERVCVVVSSHSFPSYDGAPPCTSMYIFRGSSNSNHHHVVDSSVSIYTSGRMFLATR
jgi:hypothetical protein